MGDPIRRQIARGIKLLVGRNAGFRMLTLYDMDRMTEQRASGLSRPPRTGFSALLIRRPRRFPCSTRPCHVIERKTHEICVSNIFKGPRLRASHVHCPATPHVGMAGANAARRSAAARRGCPLDQAEAYGACLTYGPGHYEIWAQWRRDRTVDPALRALVRSHEYEDWPRGRIVFDRSRDQFILYADRKLLTPAMIARIETQFHLPAERTEIQTDLHYQSKETPKALD